MTLKKILEEQLNIEIEREKSMGNKIRIPSLTKRRSIYLILFSILGIIVRETTFAAFLVIVLCAVFMVRATPIKELSKLAKKKPDTGFAAIVSENNVQSYGTNEILMMGASAIIACIFLYTSFGSYLISSEKYSPYGTGYRLDKYSTAFYSSTTEFEIPSTHEGLPVVAIGDKAFYKNSKIKKITVPDTVLEIGSRAFKGCSSLKSVTLGDNITEMGGECFMDCSSLKFVTIPKKVTAIRGNSFENCSQLISVKMHDDIKTIHGYAFRNCKSLVIVSLPKKITEIRGNTFEGCTSLVSIIIPDGVTRIAAHAFRGCSSLSHVEIPDSVTSIGSSAFRECKSLYSISIPQGASVHERSFKDTPVTISNFKFSPNYDNIAILPYTYTPDARIQDLWEETMKESSSPPPIDAESMRELMDKIDKAKNSSQGEQDD